MAGVQVNMDDEWYNSSDDEHERDRDKLLVFENILLEDNKDKFLSFLKEHYVPGLLPPVVARDIIIYGAEKCVKALLEEETGYDFDIHRSTLRSGFQSPLHLASRCGRPGLCRLLLSHGAQPNIRSRVVDSEIFHNKLPLNCVFDGLMYYV
ncbi:hypothetical protein COLO4_24270 [Corchorus olitorius]|uniref:Uncharacterized protein n=1 Tax=Corchorus olitorius TaxID=93759 RepID=A0A1R3IBW5_9ROSI|nr:hypothetical protein COLO4_24270 [Corchorus olitorius]